MPTRFRKARASETELTEEPPLSPDLGFVVQFRERARKSGTNYAGRAEHLASGLAVRFASLDELSAWMSQVILGRGH